MEYQNKHYNIEQKDEGTQDDRRRDGGTNFIFRIKEEEIRLNMMMMKNGGKEKQMEKSAMNRLVPQLKPENFCLISHTLYSV